MKKLVVVDLQKGFVNENDQDLIEKVEKLAKAGGGFDEIIATKFVNKKGSVFVKHLNYEKFLTGQETKIAFKLPKDAKIVEKTSYSIAEKDFVKLFDKDDEVFVCGLDYDACVLAICFQLFDHGICPKTIWDCTSSHSKNPAKKEELEKLYQKNFGKNNIVLSKDIVE